MNALLIKEARDLTTGATQHRTANVIGLYVNAVEILVAYRRMGKQDRIAEYEKEVSEREHLLQEHVNQLRQVK